MMRILADVMVLVVGGVGLLLTPVAAVWQMAQMHVDGFLAWVMKERHDAFKPRRSPKFDRLTIEQENSKATSVFIDALIHERYQLPRDRYWMN